MYKTFVRDDDSFTTNLYHLIKHKCNYLTQAKASYSSIILAGQSINLPPTASRLEAPRMCRMWGTDTACWYRSGVPSDKYAGPSRSRIRPVPRHRKSNSKSPTRRSWHRARTPWRGRGRGGRRCRRP